MAESAHLVGLGARTPVGLSLPAASAAVRAGIAVFGDHAYMVDSHGAPVLVAADALLPADMPLTDRLGEMCSAAAQEATQSLPAGCPVHVMLALPPPDRPGVEPGLAQRVWAAIDAALQGQVVYRSRSVVAEGHAGALRALAGGLSLLHDDPQALVLVVAADSYLTADALEWLEQGHQLYHDGNPWGFIPGEAAGAVLLGSQRLVSHLQLPSWGRLLSCGAAVEHNLIKTEQVCLGQGLTDALRGALSRLPEGRLVDRMVCDLNGEPYRADEYGYTRVRLSRVLSDPGAFLTPAESWGDVGAASGTLFVGLAAMAATRAPDHGGHVLVWTGSESGLRTAALLDLETPQRSRA
ncbi:hypothetical protein [Rhizobacter sp. OV335]|uniref:hypothetical protein n=1 Tax=Rhizobacter sp. OV335 TaxID=1500264 RepID=UPI00091215B1|nr:hypothetical protein [Rhizobacter sp. OV335]SHN13362.1 3-oxoacyl-[acyl-carrier-protein] synthase-1 [Rhizobacter sp. OV335]